MTAAEFFLDKALPKQLYESILREVEAIGDAKIRVTKSQIAFRRNRNFAWVWMPSQYLKGEVAPLVLSLSFTWRDKSPRWKEIVEPASGKYIHHLELNELMDVDAEVSDWLRKAWEAAS